MTIDTHKTIIATSLQTLLPETLIQYLWTLTDQETKDVDGALVECTLTPVKQNGKTIQLIDFFGRQHILTGFPPVQCNLYIIVYPDGNREIIPSAA